MHKCKVKATHPMAKQLPLRCGEAATSLQHHQIVYKKGNGAQLLQLKL